MAQKRSTLPKTGAHSAIVTGTRSADKKNFLTRPKFFFDFLTNAEATDRPTDVPATNASRILFCFWPLGVFVSCDRDEKSTRGDDYGKEKDAGRRKGLSNLTTPAITYPCTTPFNVREINDLCSLKIFQPAKRLRFWKFGRRWIFFAHLQWHIISTREPVYPRRGFYCQTYYLGLQAYYS